MFCGKKRKKKKVKKRTQNEEIGEIDMSIWYYIYKRVIRVRKKS